MGLLGRGTTQNLCEDTVKKIYIANLTLLVLTIITKDMAKNNYSSLLVFSIRSYYNRISKKKKKQKNHWCGWAGRIR
jgi:hypothetical protein